MADNINQYQGNAALGQGTADGGIGPIGVYEMKNVNDAVDKLMQYQVAENRDLWARNNLLVDRQAQQAANDMSFTIGDWIPKDRDTIMGKIKEMNEMYAKYPNRTRLLPDGSNAKEVAEWQQKGNEIEADIKQANRRKSQDLALIGQIDKTTDPDTRAKAAKWRENYINTGISEDILLYPDLDSFVPPAAPIFSYETDPVYYDKENKKIAYKFSAPDLGRGVANLQLIMDDPKNSAAREFIERGSKRFNDLIQRYKTENPNDTPDQLQAKLVSTTEGKTLFDMLTKTMKDIEFNNQVASQQTRAGLKGGQPVAQVSSIDWFNSGIDTNAYMKMLTSSRGITQTDIVSGEPKLGFEQQRINQQQQQIAQGWAGFNQRVKEWEATQDQKVDPLIKNSAIATLLTTPYQFGAAADPVTGMTELPLNQEMHNMFDIAIPETEMTVVDNKKGTSQKQIVDKLDIVGAFAQKVGNDPNNTKIVLKYRNPVTGEETTKPYDRASLSIAANNILGQTHSKAVAGADAKFKRELGNNNPTLEQMFPNQTEKKGAKGDTVADPLAVPMSGRNIDNTKLKIGKYYLMPDKSIQRYTGK